MKILLINTYDEGGGASKSSFELLKSFTKAGVDCKLLVFRKRKENPYILGINETKSKFLISLSSIADNLYEILFNDFSRTKFSYSYFSFINVIKIISEYNADIVHLNWINNGFISLESLKKINKPLLWTMRDSFPFTGGCHVVYDCERYQIGCGRCPLLKSKRNYDLSKWVYNRKLKIYPQIKNINFVGVSKWITEIASSSLVMKNMPIHYIPNMINTSDFKPIEKIQSRIELSLPSNFKLILFGANNVKSDYNKGFHLLLKALNLINDFNFALVIVGNECHEIIIPEVKSVFRFHHINDSNQMARLYSACDVFVAPSYQESFGLMIAEAMSCGTPTVAFNSSGQKDIIDHKINGYLAQPYEPEDLAEGINWVLNHPDYESISINARAKVVREFDSKVVAQKYIELYQSILNKGK